MSADNPLTTDDLTQMKEGVKKLDAADNLIRRSIAAGIDMKSQQAQTRELREKIQRIRQTFFPGQ